MLNKVYLHGRLAADPEVKNLTDDKKVASLRVAVARLKRNGQATGTDFVNVVAFGSAASFAGQYLAKGREVLIEGRLHHNTWETADGKRRQSYEVIAEQVQAIGRASEKTAEAREVSKPNLVAV